MRVLTVLQLPQKRICSPYLWPYRWIVWYLAGIAGKLQKPIISAIIVVSLSLSLNNLSVSIPCVEICETRRDALTTETTVAWLLGKVLHDKQQVYQRTLQKHSLVNMPISFNCNFSTQSQFSTSWCSRSCRFSVSSFIMQRLASVGSSDPQSDADIICCMFCSLLKKNVRTSRCLPIEVVTSYWIIDNCMFEKRQILM
jgi:hypothetical protein